MSNGTHRGIPSDSQIILPGGGQVIQAIEFDGFVFPAKMEPEIICILEVVYRARRGDASAAYALNTFGVNLKDLTGKHLWPMEVVEPKELDVPHN